MRLYQIREIMPSDTVNLAKFKEKNRRSTNDIEIRKPDNLLFAYHKLPLLTRKFSV